MGRDVIIFDTTLRDGEQAPGNSMTPEAKLRLAGQLDALGVDVIEAGFPSASQGDQQAVRGVTQAVRRSAVAALARCHDRDIDLAGEALQGAARPRLHVFIATSDLHLEHKLKISRDDCLARAEAAIRRARRYTDDVEFSAEDATRTDLAFLCRVVEAAIAAGATTVNLPDTVGYALPAEYGAMFRAVRERVPNSDRAVLSAHCHDDLGLAVANSLAANEAGIHQHGLLQNGLTYEIIRPEEVGVPHSTLVLGKHSGRHALERRYQELGYELDEATIAKLYAEFAALADRKREVLDEDLLALLHGRFHDAPEVYGLAHLEVTCGSTPASATVRLHGPWYGERGATASGNGPIAAAIAAISAVVERRIDVVNLAIQSVTPGGDSLGQVLVQVRVAGKSLSGHGASTDIVEAGARAVLHAINKASYADELEDRSLNAIYLWGV